MQRVTEDNMRMLKNLETTPSYYNHKVWQSERKETEHILTYMGMYPYQDGKGVRRKETKKRVTDVDDAWLRSIATLSRKSALSLPGYILSLLATLLPRRCLDNIWLTCRVCRAYQAA